jgi:hypothetical protein
MSNQYLSLRRSLSFILSFSLAFSGVPFQAAFAEGESVNSFTGSGGSISIDFVDLNGNPISKESLRPGTTVCMHASAHTPSGGSVPCAQPNFRPIQGVSGNQLGQPDANGCMVVGNNFGTAEVAVQCRELPGIEGKTQVANVGSLMTPAQKLAAKQAAEAPAGPSAGQQALIGVALGLAVVGVVVAVAAAKAGSTSSCRCSSGKYYVPANNACQTCPQANNSCFGSPSPGYVYCP